MNGNYELITFFLLIYKSMLSISLQPQAYKPFIKPETKVGFVEREVRYLAVYRLFVCAGDGAQESHMPGKCFITELHAQS